MLHLICCCLDYPKYSTQDTDCKLSALFFNGFFMVFHVVMTDGQSINVSADVCGLHEA